MGRMMIVRRNPGDWQFHVIGSAQNEKAALAQCIEGRLAHPGSDYGYVEA